MTGTLGSNETERVETETVKNMLPPEKSPQVGRRLWLLVSKCFDALRLVTVYIYCSDQIS